MDKLNMGAEALVTAAVGCDNTALAMGSGSLEVLATPAVVALMEQAACRVVQDSLEEGVTTVGTMISIEHLSASPVGAEIKAKAVLTETDGRKYCFDVEAFDNSGLIAKGKHQRFAVRSERFMEKANSKLYNKEC